MKIKVKVIIPQQEHEIEMDFQPIWEMEPPVFPDPPIVEPEPDPEPVDDLLDLDMLFTAPNSSSAYVPNHYRYVKSKGMIKPRNIRKLFGDGVTLYFKTWEDAPAQLFDLNGCEEFAVVGIMFAIEEQRPIMTALPYKSLFGWTRNEVKLGKFAWINPPEVKDKEKVTYGLSNFCYSSDSDDRIYLIGKNVHHNGYLFTQCKNPYKGNLWLILLHCSVHNPILIDVGGPKSSPSSMYYTPSSFKVRIDVIDGIATIISDNTFDQIKTWVGYNEGNQRSILHFDRYVFDINDQNLINNKRIKLGGEAHGRATQLIAENIFCSDVDLSPGDNLSGYGKIISKQIDEDMVERIREDGSKWWDRRSNWTYKYEPNNLSTQINLPSGQFDAYIVHKGNALFFYPIDKNTKFGDWWVTLSQGFGWSWYNEEFSGYIEGFKGGGYFRNSTGSGITQGLSIYNSTFEKNGPNATEFKDLPEDVANWIDGLELI